MSNITIAPDSGVGLGSVHLVIKARTAAGIYQTLCTVQTPASAQQLFPATGPLTNCTPWAPLAT
ncbi:hypothetical protein [Nonomuraea cavernae]|uniref:hypothetical protein n=1 Tax=Nonomuraea cavernae TaxID=2045107 RepID=UPI0033F867FF